ncbi:Mth938-like domain-containing protein [Rhodobacteraceae bacterium XHP0102]|nr:Mth938-like domain-containing protein [Rhodobacteraceae bacterium XHP0102]
MELNEVRYNGGLPIDGYGAGFFRIDGTVYEGAQLILPNGRQDWGGYVDAAPLLAAAGLIDVLLIGTGAEIAHIPNDLRGRLEGAGIGIEVMGTPSAARSYNVLLGEGRRIGAALLPV